MKPVRLNGAHVLAPALGLGIAMVAQAEGTAPPPTVENAMREILVGETEVATVGKFRVALAKTWEETRNGQKVRIAWLSVVEKGSGNGPKDVELVSGDPLVLGGLSFNVAEVTLAAEGKSGTVLLREKAP